MKVTKTQLDGNIAKDNQHEGGRRHDNDDDQVLLKNKKDKSYFSNELKF